MPADHAPPGRWRAGARCARPGRPPREPTRSLRLRHPRPRDREVGGLERQRPRHAVGLAGPQREQQVARLEVRPADHVHQRQAGRDRPAGIDAQQVAGGNSRLVALAEAEPARRRARRAPGAATARPRAAFGQLHAERRQDRAHDAHALVDVAADQELLGGAPLQLDRLRGGGAGRRRRGTPGPPRARGRRWPGRRRAVDERAARRLACPPAQLQRQPVEAGRAVEGQGLGRLRRRGQAYSAALLRLAGRPEVRGQRSRDRRARGQERRGQPVWQSAQLLGTELARPRPRGCGRDRPRSPRAAGRARACARGARRAASASARVVPRSRPAARAATPHRAAARHRDHVEQPARGLGQAARRAPDDGVERHRRPPAGRRALGRRFHRRREADQLLDEERVAARLPRDRFRRSSGRRARPRRRTVGQGRAPRRPDSSPTASSRLSADVADAVAAAAGARAGAGSSRPRRCGSSR